MGAFYNHRYDLERLNNFTSDISSLDELAVSSKDIGFDTYTFFKPLDKLKNEIPFITQFSDGQYVVVEKINKKIHVADPRAGWLAYNETEFLELLPPLVNVKGVKFNLSHLDGKWPSLKDSSRINYFKELQFVWKNLDINCHIIWKIKNICKY